MPQQDGKSFCSKFDDRTGVGSLPGSNVPVWLVSHFLFRNRTQYCRCEAGMVEAAKNMAAQYPLARR
jgi:hypothetical protein